MQEERFEQELTTGTKIPQIQTGVQPEGSSLSIQSNFCKAKIELSKIIKGKNLEEFMEENFLHQYIPTLHHA